jgi:hypothetical protein
MNRKSLNILNKIIALFFIIAATVFITWAVMKFDRVTRQEIEQSIGQDVNYAIFTGGDIYDGDSIYIHSYIGDGIFYQINAWCVSPSDIIETIKIDDYIIYHRFNSMNSRLITSFGIYYDGYYINEKDFDTFSKYY